MRRRLLGSSVLAIAMMIGAATAARAEDVLKIGSVAPNTGVMALTGADLVRSYEIAIDQINAQGGLLGKKVVLVRGDATNAQEGIAAVEQLVGREKVDLLVGTIITALSTAASEAAASHEKLYWETNAVADDLTGRGLPNFARSGLNGNAFARTAVETVRDLVAAKIGKAPKDIKVWIEHEESGYGTALATDLQKLLGEAGMQVVGNSAHNAGAIDLTSSILRAKATAPDVWINAGYLGDTHLLLRTAHDQSFTPPTMIAVGLGDTAETLNALGKEALEGLLVVCFPRYEVNPNYGPGATAFRDAYVKKYGTPPLASSGMAGYVGIKVLFEAIKAAGSTDYEKVLKAAAAMDKPIGSYETGYGVKFDANMQNTRAQAITVQWQDGKIVAVYPRAAALDGTKLVDLQRH